MRLMKIAIVLLPVGAYLMASFAFTDIISKKYGTSVPNWKNLDLIIAFVHYDYDLLQ